MRGGLSADGSPTRGIPPSHRERRQEAILDAAEALFIERGFDKTRLAEIVQRSGGSLATLYELFDNKQGLLHAIALRWRDETINACEDWDTVLGQSNIETLMGYVRKEREIWESPRTVALIRMLVSECLRDRDFALQIYRNLHLPFIARISELIAQWTKAGEARIDDPEAGAHLFLSIVSGDMFSSKLFGLEEGIPTQAQIHWRLQPFVTFFGI